MLASSWLGGQGGLLFHVLVNSILQSYALCAETFNDRSASGILRLWARWTFHVIPFKNSSVISARLLPLR